MRLLALVLALSAAPAFADAPAQTLQACLQVRFEAMDLDLGNAVGVSVAVLPMQGGGAWQGARGLADRERGEALTTGHAFRIASNTKTYTAAAVLRLAELGKLGLDDAIAAHLPNAFITTLEKGGYDPQAITVRHLLTHTAGLREHVSGDFLLRQAGPDAREWTVPEQLELAMAAGAPLAHRSAGLVLAGSALMRLPESVALARRCRRIIHQNLGWALAYNVVALPFAALGWVTPGLAALGMAASSLVVTANALRLGRAPRGNE